MSLIIKLILIFSFFLLSGCDYRGYETGDIESMKDSGMTIYAYDTSYLVEILNGTATIFGMQGSLEPLFGVGIIFSLFVMGIKGALTGKYEVTTFLGSIFLFSILFVPKITVAVQDYDNNTNVVTIANVPWGVAAVALFSSNIGKSLSDIYTQSFSTADMYQIGFLSPLRIITDMIDIGAMSSYEATNGVYESETNTYTDNKFSNFDKSISNYMTDCVIKDIYADTSDNINRSVTHDRLNKSGDSWGAMMVTANGIAWNTIVYFDPQDPGNTAQYGISRVITCSEAYNGARPSYIDGTAISGSSGKGLSYFIVAGSGGISALYEEMNRKIAKLYKVETFSTMTGDDITSTNNLIGKMFSSHATAYEFMKNGYLRWQFAKAKAGNNLTASVQEYQAIKQRQLQFASERSMFAEMAIPVASFIQSIIFFAAPLIAFAMLLGPIGIGLAVKYLQLALWVSTWDIMMSVINLFTYSAFQKKMEELAATLAGKEKTITSFDNLDRIYTEANSFLAVAGNLAAATPIITYALLTGGSYALVSAVNRVTSSGDHFDEKAAGAPSLTKADIGRFNGGNREGSVFNGGSQTGYGVSGNNIGNDLVTGGHANGVGSSLVAGVGGGFKTGQSVTSQTQTSDSLSNLITNAIKLSNQRSSDSGTVVKTDASSANQKISNASDVDSGSTKLDAGAGVNSKNINGSNKPTDGGNASAAVTPKDDTIKAFAQVARASQPSDLGGTVMRALKTASPEEKQTMKENLGLKQDATDEQIANATKEAAKTEKPNEGQVAALAMAGGAIAKENTDAESMFSKLFDVDGIKQKFGTLNDDNATTEQKLLALGGLAFELGSLTPAGFVAKTGIKMAANSFGKEALERVIQGAKNSKDANIRNAANLMEQSKNNPSALNKEISDTMKNLNEAERKALKERIDPSDAIKKDKDGNWVGRDGKKITGADGKMITNSEARQKKIEATPGLNKFQQAAKFMAKTGFGLDAGISTSLSNTESVSSGFSLTGGITSSQSTQATESINKSLEGSVVAQTSKQQALVSTDGATKTNSVDEDISAKADSSIGFRWEIGRNQNISTPEFLNNAAHNILTARIMSANPNINQGIAKNLAKMEASINSPSYQSAKDNAVELLKDGKLNDLAKILSSSGSIYNNLSKALDRGLMPSLTPEQAKGLATNILTKMGGGKEIEQMEQKYNELMSAKKEVDLNSLLSNSNAIKQAADNQMSLNPKSLYDPNSVNAFGQKAIEHAENKNMGLWDRISNGGIDAEQEQRDLKNRGLVYAEPGANSININPNSIRNLLSDSPNARANLLQRQGFSPNANINDMFGAKGMLKANDMKFGSEAAAKAFASSLGASGAIAEEQGNKELSGVFMNALQESANSTWGNATIGNKSQDTLKSMLDNNSFTPEEIAEYRKQREKEKGILSTQTSDGKQELKTGEVPKPTDQNNVMKAEDLKLNDYSKGEEKAPLIPVPLPNPTSEKDRNNVNEFDPEKIMQNNPPSAGIPQATSGQSKVFGETLNLEQAQGSGATPAQNTVTSQPTTDNGIVSFEQSKFNDAVALKTTVGDNGQIEMSRVQISTGKEEVFFKGDMTMGAESAEALTNERLNQANKNNELTNETKGENLQPKKIEQMKSDNVNYGTTNKDTSYPVSSVESTGQGNVTVDGLSTNSAESVSRTPMNMNYDVEQGVVTSNGVPTGFGEPIRLNNEEHYEATNQNFNESQISESRDIGTNDTADNIKSINVNGVWHLAVENNDGTYTKINLKDNS